MKLRALVIDDEEFARKNLIMLLEEYCPDVEVIGEASKKVKPKHSSKRPNQMSSF